MPPSTCALPRAYPARHTHAAPQDRSPPRRAISITCPAASSLLPRDPTPPSQVLRLIQDAHTRLLKFISAEQLEAWLHGIADAAVNKMNLSTADASAALEAVQKVLAGGAGGAGAAGGAASAAAGDASGATASNSVFAEMVNRFTGR